MKLKQRSAGIYILGAQLICGITHVLAKCLNEQVFDATVNSFITSQNKKSVI